MRRLYYWLLIVIILLLTLIGPFALLVKASSASSSAPSVVAGDWSTYLFSNGSSGYNAAETIITRKTVSNLKAHWSYKDPAAGIISVQPVEANGLIYWGSWNDGTEHATNLSGEQVWGTSVGVSPPANCGKHTLGVASTATIANETIGGQKKSVLYVGGGDVNFYALDALTGAQIWKTPLGAEPDHFIWSSPAVFSGSVYIGLASRGDCPLVQGQLLQLDAITGQVQHIFNVVPNGCIGGSVWGSPTIDAQAGTLYFVTGNGGSCSQSELNAIAMVELRTSDLAFLGSWKVPPTERSPDGDFGSTPTLFQATISGNVTKLVGATNKNGIYYSLKRDALAAGPVWKATIAIGGACPECGDGSISPAAWDGMNLYVAGGHTSINGNSCKGSLRSLDAATGSFQWQKCFVDGTVLAAVSMVPGVVFAGEGGHLVAVATGTGKSLFDFHTGARIYGAPSISNGVVYVGSTKANLYALGL